MDGFLYIPSFSQAPPAPHCGCQPEPPLTALLPHALNNSPGLLQGARQLEVLARFAKSGARDKSAEEVLQSLAEVVADGQHHDAITGRSTFLVAPLQFLPH